MAYEDGTEVEIEADSEDPPQSGEWVDSEVHIANPTRDELAMGKVLGEQIIVEDDDDNGARIVKAIEVLR
jgi:hypothetical protein